VRATCCLQAQVASEKPSRNLHLQAANAPDGAKERAAAGGMIGVSDPATNPRFLSSLPGLALDDEFIPIDKSAGLISFARPPTLRSYGAPSKVEDKVSWGVFTVPCQMSRIVTGRVTGRA
jgi:hypothetical protein